MPWQALGFPSLPLGLLHSVIRQRLPEVEVSEIYANLRWADRFALRGIPIARYDELSNTVFRGIGDFVFSGALHRSDTWRLDEFMIVSKVDESERGLLEDLQPEAHRFIEDLRKRSPGPIRTSSASRRRSCRTSRRSPLLARSRRAGPRSVTMMGVATWTARKGAAIHRIFPRSTTSSRRRRVAFLGCCARSTAGPTSCRRWAASSGATPRRNGGECGRRAMPMNEIPTPDFDAFFEQLEAPRRTGDPTHAGARSCTGLLVGREAPLQVLRAQPNWDEIPLQAPGRRLEQHANARRAPSAAGKSSWSTTSWTCGISTRCCPRIREKLIGTYDCTTRSSPT